MLGVVALGHGVELHAIAVVVVAGAGAEGLRGGPLHGVFEGLLGCLFVGGSRRGLRAGGQTAMHWSVCGQSRRAAVCTMLSTGGRSIPGGEVRAGARCQGVGGRVVAETRCESWACRESRYYR